MHSALRPFPQPYSGFYLHTSNSTFLLIQILQKYLLLAYFSMQKDDPRKSLEISPQSIVIVQEMAARINQDGGIYSEKLLFFFLS